MDVGRVSSDDLPVRPTGATLPLVSAGRGPDELFRMATAATAAVIILVLVGLIGLLLMDASPALVRYGPDFLTTSV